MTSPLRDAYNAHAQLDIVGLKINYGLDDVPNDPPTSRGLPCLLPAFVEQSSQFQLLAVSAGQNDQEFTPSFVLLYKDVSDEPGAHVIAGTLVDLFWHYTVAIAGNSDLDDTLANDTQYTAEFGVFPYLGREYLGIKFTHTWRFIVD